MPCDVPLLNVAKTKFKYMPPFKYGGEVSYRKLKVVDQQVAQS